MANKKRRTRTNWQDFEVIGGHLIYDRTDKEELLNVLINVMSSRGQVVVYSILKELSCEELVKKLENLPLRFNSVVYVYDMENNRRIYKARVDDERRSVEFCGYKLIIESFESFKGNIMEREMEGNTISYREEDILKDIEKIEEKNERNEKIYWD